MGPPPSLPCRCLAVLLDSLHAPCQPVCCCYFGIRVTHLLLLWGGQIDAYQWTGGHAYGAYYSVDVCVLGGLVRGAEGVAGCGERGDNACV